MSELYSNSRLSNLNLLSDRLKMLTEMLNASMDCIKVVNTDGTLAFMNKSGCLALGLCEDEKDFGMDWINLLPACVHRRGHLALKKAINGQCARFSGMSISSDGTTMYWDNMLTPVTNDAGHVTSILCVSRDITRQTLAENKLRATSEQDDLTGLANRRYFKRYLKQALDKAKKHNYQVGLLLMDLDHFKDINDSLGHAAGDKLLKQLTLNFLALKRNNVFFARLGGDEFAAVISKINNHDELTAFADNILNNIDRKIQYGKNSMPFSISIGGAIYPQQTTCIKELMKYADNAMYHLKKNGRDGFYLFEQKNSLENQFNSPVRPSAL